MAKPTASQLQWADMELGVIIHYVISSYAPEGTVAYKTCEVRDKLPPSIFAPQGWDTDQWMGAAAAMGAKYAVFVANHCEGFSLWQTKVNDYSVASCSYQDGAGDVFRDFLASCKKFGIKPGVYYSTGCNGYYDINDDLNGEEFWQSDKYKAYVKHVEAQVKELWSEYGEMFEIWFDGGIIPLEKGGPNLVPILEKYQPHAVCFQGPIGRVGNLRWVGNEDGLAPAECWSCTNVGAANYDGTTPDEEAGIGDPDGIFFCPAETDMPNRSHEACGTGWGWAPNQARYAFSKEYLLDCYVRSVGRNSNLLLGMGIANNGRFEDEAQFREFGQLLRDTFGEAACKGRVLGTSQRVQSLQWDVPVDVHYVVLRENMEEGHRIRGFRVLADGVQIAEGQCIGHKRILPVSLQQVHCITVEITRAVDDPLLRDIAVY